MLKNLTRRKFVQGSMAAGLAATAAPSFSLPKPQGQIPPPLNIDQRKRALVCIMLDGGNDSYNMLVPRSQAHYQEYSKTRGNLALAKDQLLPLNGFKDGEGREFALHPSMSEVAELFDQEKLSFVANIAPLIEPTNKQAFLNRSARVPLGLLSHADQFKHWQTSRPDLRVQQGWFGYFADVLQANKKADQIPMNISLAGSNIMQNGRRSTHYSITGSGSVGLVVNEEESALNRAILRSFETVLNTSYSGDPFKQTYLSITREAQLQHQKFSDAVEKVSLPIDFSDSDLSQQLSKVAQCIAAAEELGLPQQTYFLRYIGWDHHDDLLANQARMLRVLSKAMGEFQRALELMGLSEQVLSFTGSDFGRTLTSNGNGSDHGWGGHCMVMGDAVKGGKVLGEYPALSLGDNNPLDVGGGVLIPTLPTDVLFAQLSMWFGVSEEDIPRLFPNLQNFAGLTDDPWPRLDLLKS
ncbi:DUF1501 domain-containing protein [Pseudoteredinibacter isoporae]|uniref:Uncharacterized protein (DUF1501 family) n=1 Tax=Pseudoteredinibacter isoporae TaxID=570281 RepID=A0A7X0JSI8_9GAMM|nr:DUF1501 domain-containing protein [Pseudoteredinibacter isoporae]MBB6520571.1 uncharacterized protein (DUF1501 family) [Pseudoteredinibacter isoporae]NHO86138.1 DUF1501 domain-containing protein [Pseudoteredinibacter isoporae]NIB25411.1 DUF1501 domain-containing protein [Pseudoteredinibacter isoporae]